LWFFETSSGLYEANSGIVATGFYRQDYHRVKL